MAETTLVSNIVFYTEEEEEDLKQQNASLLRCPECGSDDIMIAGHCTTCFSCGWSACSL